MVGTKARHLQRVAHAAAGIACQILQRTVDIVVGNHDGIAFLEKSLDALRRLALLLAVLLRQHPGPGLACAALGAAAKGGLVEFHGFDRHRLHPELWC